MWLLVRSPYKKGTPILRSFNRETLRANCWLPPIMPVGRLSNLTALCPPTWRTLTLCLFWSETLSSQPVQNILHKAPRLENKFLSQCMKRQEGFCHSIYIYCNYTRGGPSFFFFRLTFPTNLKTSEKEHQFSVEADEKKVIDIVERYWTQMWN